MRNRPLPSRPRCPVARPNAVPTRSQLGGSRKLRRSSHCLKASTWRQQLQSQHNFGHFKVQHGATTFFAAMHFVLHSTSLARGCAAPRRWLTTKHLATDRGCCSRREPREGRTRMQKRSRTRGCCHPRPPTARWRPDTTQTLSSPRSLPRKRSCQHTPNPTRAQHYIPHPAHVTPEHGISIAGPCTRIPIVALLSYRTFFRRRRHRNGRWPHRHTNSTPARAQPQALLRMKRRIPFSVCSLSPWGCPSEMKTAAPVPAPACAAAHPLWRCRTRRARLQERVQFGLGRTPHLPDLFRPLQLHPRAWGGRQRRSNTAMRRRTANRRASTTFY